MSRRNPIEPFLAEGRTLLLDGGLATELEARGHDLRHPLWSAKLLREDPRAIEGVHRTFLASGADCVISASYQATPQGLVESGLTRDEARKLILESWRIARRACELHSAESGAQPAPIAAASIGPYGAYLADGSEYRGDYGLDAGALVEFHRERVELLAPVATLLAIETVPSLPEALAYARLLAEHPDAFAWVSFCCQDGERIADGTPIEDAVAPFDDLPQVVAVGVNCTPPTHVASLVERIGARGTDKEIIVYPNSGERFRTDDKGWDAAPEEACIERLAGSWRAHGARLIGGCCRVSAADLARIRGSLGP
ncbi:MAG: homocysteine S-methyltransferase [Planctomycetota bacterium]